MAPMGVATQNICSKTIHSELKIAGNIFNLKSLSTYDEESSKRLKKIEYTVLLLKRFLWYPQNSLPL
jgi:hypothetical protein